MSRSWQEQRLRNLLGASATGVMVGLGLSVSDAQALGGWITMGSLLCLLWMLHRYGRTGPDSPR